MVDFSKKMTEAQLNEALRRLDEHQRQVEASDKKEDCQYGADARGDELPAEMVEAQQQGEVGEGLGDFSVELHLLAIAHNVTKLFRFQQGVGKATAAA